jgi:hypothetical protein
MIENRCIWLTIKINELPLVTFPFNLSKLPESGIYFFFEKGEECPLQKGLSRIVRIGTANYGQFRSRISQHYLLEERKMNFDAHHSKPSDRSIFRKNLGRAILNRNEDSYLQVWNIDFQITENRNNFWQLRKISKEWQIEEEITSILRSDFSFRYLDLSTVLENLPNRFQYLLEEHLIGTLGHCSYCGPSETWLGLFSPEPKIRASGLWQVQHLDAEEITDEEIRIITEIMKKRS